VHISAAEEGNFEIVFAEEGDMIKEEKKEADEEPKDKGAKGKKKK
jgi:hypothetical protein